MPSHVYLLAFTFLIFSSQGFSNQLYFNSDLEKRIKHVSNGESFEEQIESIKKQTNLYFTYEPGTDLKRKLKVKKFYYPNTRVKYILMRLCKEVGLQFNAKGDTVHLILIPSADSNVTTTP